MTSNRKVKNRGDRHIPLLHTLSKAIIGPSIRCRCVQVGEEACEKSAVWTQRTATRGQRRVVADPNAVTRQKSSCGGREAKFDCSMGGIHISLKWRWGVRRRRTVSLVKHCGPTA